MEVTLTTAVKNWLAINAGVSNCFSPTGVVYQLPDEVTPRTGSTGDVVNALYTGHLLGFSDVAIVAGMDYNGIKALNGGADLTMGSNIPGVYDGDVKWVYANDGATSDIPAYCAPPANIISTDLVLDKTICSAPCTVTATATWTNTGVSPGTFAPGITVDNGTPQTASPQTLISGGTVTQPFSITGLAVAVSPHNICTTPGTHCQSVYTVATIDVCSWIISLGGWNRLRVYDIMQMVLAYLGNISVGYTVTTLHIMGAVAYYLGMPANGDSLTGCVFASP